MVIEPVVLLSGFALGLFIGLTVNLINKVWSLFRRLIESG